MSRLTWSIREYEVGVSHGVFYPPVGPAKAWNGLISVKDSPESTEDARYLDGQKIMNRRREGSFAGTLSAYTYPDSFYDLITQRRMTSFGMTYRTETADAYRIHLLYNIFLGQAQVEHSQNTPGEYSWELSTKPIEFPEGKFTSHLFAEVSKAYPEAISDLEDVLYGSSEGEAHLPDAEELYAIFENNAILKVIDHGDGTFTVDGPDEAIVMLDSTTFEITWPSAVYLDSETYKISSL